MSASSSEPPAVATPGPVATSSPSPYEPPSSRRRRSRTPLYVGVGVVVVAVIVVVAVVLPSLGPGAPSIPKGAITYGQGAAGANYSVRSFQKPSTWSLLFAVGLEAPTGETAALAVSDLGISNCSIAPASGAPSNLTLPAFVGNRTSGEAPLWEFFYQNFSTGSVAVVAVENGQATVLGNITTPECSSIFNILGTIPAQVLNSPAAGAAVAANASAFLAAHPTSSAVYGLIGPVFGNFPGSTLGAKWVVEFSTCAVTPNPTGVGAEYNATVNATSGAVVYAQNQSSVSCASDPPAAVAFAPLQGLVAAIARSGTEPAPA
jgi:hypothetical protein